MLSSVPELHGYIDKSQLTEDLGGTLAYCHSRWLCHRTVSPPPPKAPGCPAAWPPPAPRTSCRFPSFLPEHEPMVSVDLGHLKEKRESCREWLSGAQEHGDREKFKLGSRHRPQAGPCRSRG